MPTYVIPSFCAAAAIGCTGNPTIPNMYCTPCFLRLLATSVAPSTSAIGSLSCQIGSRCALRSRPTEPESSPPRPLSDRRGQELANVSWCVVAQRHILQSVMARPGLGFDLHGRWQIRVHHC